MITKPENTGLDYKFKVRYKTGGGDDIWTINDQDVAHYEKDPDMEILLEYGTSTVTIDGLDYRRNAHYGIATPKFYTMKEDFSHVPDKHIRWDSRHEQLHYCLNCSKEWKLSERTFLVYGEIVCDHCGAVGSTAGSAW